MTQKKNRARTVNLKDGVYVHVGDFMQALSDEALVMECAAMIKIAQQQKLDPIAGVRLCIANAMNEVTGINAMMEPGAAAKMRQRVARIVIEGGEPPRANGERH
ncbi:MAG: hypothetical protein KGL39_39645 [Patescibacteria group bacterium]|nr:hypothetical protein [Patescibacteria group bacterium]